MPRVHIIDLYFLGHKAAIGSFLIRAIPPEVGDILIETGPHSTLDALSKGLEAHGSSCARVKHIFITHIHLDHAGAAWFLAQTGAKIYVHPIGLPHLMAPERLMTSATRIYGDDMERLWGDVRSIAPEQLQAAEDGASFEVGGHCLRAHHTPGHAYHHIAWQVEDTLFTGDVAGVRIADGPIIPPCPPPDIDIKAWEQSLEKMANLTPRVLQLTHYGAVDRDIPAHLKEVRIQLHGLLAWIKTAINNQTINTDQGLQIALKNHMCAQMRATPLDKYGEQAYLAANPPFMSVLGLKRYLKKHTSV